MRVNRCNYSRGPLFTQRSLFHCCNVGDSTVRFRVMSGLALLCFSATLSACAADPKAPTASNFEAAIRSEYVKHDQLLCESTNHLPYKQSLNTAYYSGDSEIDAQTAALRHAGLVSIGYTRVRHAADNWSPAWTERVRTVTLTAYGKRYARTGTGMLGGVNTEFCYGIKTPDNVTNFTEPGDVMGMHVTSVTYIYHIADVPSWAKDSEVHSAYSDLAGYTDGGGRHTATMDLVLTNNGWQASN